MRTSELLENTAPGFWAYLGLTICILTGIILALRIVFTYYAHKSRMAHLRRFERNGHVGSPQSDWENQAGTRMRLKVHQEKTRHQVGNCVQFMIVFLATVFVFYHVGAWDIKTGSSASKVADKIETRFALTEGWQGPGIQGREFMAPDDETLSLDVSGDSVAFKDSAGKNVDTALYKRLTETEVITYIKNSTVLENPVLDTPKGWWQKMPSLKDMEGTATDPLLTVKGTMSGQVVTVNIASEDGVLTGTLAESSGRGFEADQVFR